MESSQAGSHILQSPSNNGNCSYVTSNDGQPGTFQVHGAPEAVGGTAQMHPSEAVSEARKRISNPDGKLSRAVSWMPKWTDQKQQMARDLAGSSPTVRRGMKSGVAASPAIRIAAKYPFSSSSVRPLSVGPPSQRSQVISNRRTHAASVNIPAQRRIANQQQQKLLTRFDSDKSVKAATPSAAAEVALPRRVGQHGSEKHSEACPCGPSSATTHCELPLLQKRRTWRLLQHLVDQLEAEGQSHALLQYPEVLQKLLKALMPLIQQKDALGNLSECTQANGFLSGRVSNGSNDCSSTLLAQIPYSGPQSSATRQTSAPASGQVAALSNTANSDTRSLHKPLSASSRVRLARATQDAGQGLPGPLLHNAASAKASLRHRGRPTSALRNASNRLQQESASQNSPGSRTYLIAKRDISNPAGTRGMTISSQATEKPRPSRAISTGRYLHVASRLPQGALQHRRHSRTTNQAVLLHKNNDGGKPVLPSFVTCASSTNLNHESVMEPVSSARSDDSGSRFDSGVTPSLGSFTEDSMEPCSAQQFDTGSGAIWWAGSTLERLALFRTSRNIQALPPSSQASNFEDDTPEQSVESPAAHESRQSSGRAGVVPAVSETQSPTTAVRRRRLVEPSNLAARRQTAVVVSSAQASGEGDKLPAISEKFAGVLAPPEKRERRFTTSDVAKFKSTAASFKGGRLVLTADELDKESRDGQATLPVPPLKDVPKIRQGRRATTQVTTPKSTNSPRLSAEAKAKREKSPILTKKLAKRDSRSSLNPSSASPRESPQAVPGGRRMSAPPPRRAIQAKIAAALPPPRARAASTRGAPAGVPSSSLKAPSARRKTVKLPSSKVRGQSVKSQKDEELLLPETEGLDKGDGDVEDEKSGEMPTAVETEPEPPYPYLTLKELPALEKPVRPLPNLSALPLKAGLDPPPPIDDSVTFTHVLDRNERLTEAGRDEATQHAVSSLCNDGPDTMLLVARWLDTAADTVESNTIAAAEGLPWRDVIPPLFIGVNRHRELLNPTAPPKSFSPKELRTFFEAEGFIETQEQKLQHLLETKSLPTKPSDGVLPFKSRTPLDSYLDCLLAIAVTFLRRRRQPVVFPKITRLVIGVGQKPHSSCSCCECFPNDVDIENDHEMHRTYCGAPAFGSRVHASQRRCASCLTVRGPSTSCLSMNTPCTQSRGLFCCSPGDICGPPELDLFESTAMQQVRAAVRQMPVLPSERYLRYLRLTGRRRELTALAVWLAGRPDIIPTFSEHDPSEPEQTFSSPPENSCEMKTEHANPPSGVFEKGSSASFSSGNDEVPEKRTVLRENAPSPAAAGEGEEARELGRQGDGGVQGSCSDIFPRPSPCLPDENHGEAVASLGRRNGSLEALRDESETAGNLRSGCKTTDMDTGGDTISLSTSKQVSADLLPAMKANLVPRDLPVDPETHKVGSQAPANPAQDQLILPTATAGAKAKAKKQPTVKNPPPRLAHVAQKAIARSKISRPLGQAQWQAPGMPGEVPAARDPQRAAKTQHLRHSRVVAGDMVKCQPPESDYNAAAMPVEKGSDISASKAPQGSPVKLSSQSDEEPTTVAAAQLPVDTPPRGPRSNFQKKQPLMQSRLIASRASSSKLFNGPKNGLRRPSAASLPGRRGTTFGVDPTTQPTADPAQLTQEAVDLLSEPQMLAEMATLCVRLSDLFCCRSATSSVDQPSGGQAAMERPSEFEQEPI